MVVTTKNGSKYLFNTNENKVYLLYGSKEYVVDKFSLGIGLPLEVHCRKLNLYTYEESTESTLIITSAIVSIEL